MKEAKLKELLEKYYNGDTSVEEEMELKKYFSGDNIIPGFEAEKEIFCHYSENEILPEPSGDLESRIMKSIDDLDKNQRYSHFKNRYIASISIAATILILVGSYFFFIHKAEPRDTYSDPRLAYAETMKILNEVSVKLNKGTRALQPISKLNSATRSSLETIDRSATIITESFERIKLVIKLSDIDDRNIK